MGIPRVINISAAQPAPEIPPEVMVEHMKRLQVAPAEKPAPEPEASVQLPVVITEHPKAKRRRARTASGEFRADDPATPADEAWVEVAEVEAEGA